MTELILLQEEGDGVKGALVDENKCTKDYTASYGILMCFLFILQGSFFFPSSLLDCDRHVLLCAILT